MMIDHANTPVVVLPPVGQFDQKHDYVARVERSVTYDRYWSPEEHSFCPQFDTLIKKLESQRRRMLWYIGAGTVAYVCLGFFVKFVFEDILQNKKNGKRIDSTVAFFGALCGTFGAASLILYSKLIHLVFKSSKSISEMRNLYHNKCVEEPMKRRAEAAEAAYKAAHPEEAAELRVSIQSALQPAAYAVSAEAMAAKRPSAFGLFARDAWNAAERFSDGMVATAVYDFKLAGEIAYDLAKPLVIGAAVAVGVVAVANRARMTGVLNFSPIQGALALVR